MTCDLSLKTYARSPRFVSLCPVRLRSGHALWLWVIWKNKANLLNGRINVNVLSGNDYGNKPRSWGRKNKANFRKAQAISCHSCESRNPVFPNSPGFRIECGMTRGANGCGMAGRQMAARRLDWVRVWKNVTVQGAKSQFLAWKGGSLIFC